MSPQEFLAMFDSVKDAISAKNPNIRFQSYLADALTDSGMFVTREQAEEMALLIKPNLNNSFTDEELDNLAVKVSDCLVQVGEAYASVGFNRIKAIISLAPTFEINYTF